MGSLRDEFPPILTSVEEIIDHLIRGLKETWYEKLLREMRNLVVRLQNIQFANTTARKDQNSNPEYEEFAVYLRRVVEMFNNEPSQGDPVLARLKEEFPRDLQLQSILAGQDVKIDEFNLMIGPLLLPKFKKWIKRLEQKVKSTRNYIILSASKHLDDDLEVPGESMEPRDPKNFVRLAKVLPIVNIIDRFDSVGKEIQFLGTNGRVYKYLFTSQEQSNNCATQIDSRREERVFQLQRMLSPLLAKRRRTSWRSIDINSLRVIPIAPMVRLVQSINGISLFNIYQSNITKKKLDPQGPVNFYYSKVKSPIDMNTHNSESTLKEVFDNIQKNYVSPNILCDWARETYGNRTEYLAFKSKFLYSLATQSIVSYGYGLCQVHPDQWLIEKKTGSIYIHGQRMENNFNFRLSPGLAKFTTICQSRHALLEAIEAASSSILHNQFTIVGITRGILRDEELKRKSDFEEVVVTSTE